MQHIPTLIKQEVKWQGDYPASRNESERQEPSARYHRISPCRKGGEGRGIEGIDIGRITIKLLYPRE
jgi:hypothetical protein